MTDNVIPFKPPAASPLFTCQFCGAYLDPETEGPTCTTQELADNCVVDRCVREGTWPKEEAGR